MRAAPAWTCLALLAASVACSDARFRAAWPTPPGATDSGAGGADGGDDKPGDSGDDDQPVVECEPAVAEAVEELDASLIEEGDVHPWCSEAQSEADCAASHATPEDFQAQSERGCSTWTASGRDYACLPTWVDGKCCAEVVFAAPDHEGCDE